MRTRIASSLLLATCLATAGGCAAFGLAGAMAQSAEYQKKIEVLPEYDGLAGKRVAVIVDADLGLLYEWPNLTQQICGGVSARIQQNVEGAAVLNPNEVIRWQYRTPQWNVLPFSEMAEQLNAERLVYVRVYDFRLHPPGNRWIWEGVCAATIEIIESDGGAPDIVMETFEVAGLYPTESGITRDDATAQAIEFGVLSEFIKRATWLFYTHLEPKYPDQYRPELD